MINIENIRIKGLVDEDFINYKRPSMYIATCFCDWKCCNDLNLDVSICQNSKLAESEIKSIPIKHLFDRYMKNPITKSIVFGGLEPLIQMDELLVFIEYFRNHGCYDDIIIYSGYDEYEIPIQIAELSRFENIIVKFGRYIPDSRPIFDKVLGKELVSENQYAKRI